MDSKDSKNQYEPLLSGDASEATEKGLEVYVGRDRSASSHSYRKLAVRGALVLQALVICVLVGLLLRKNDCPINPVFPQVLYSPAQDALEYQPKTFSMGFGSRKSIYQGHPSPEVDQAWLDLYDWFGLSKVPKWQARLLPNKTLAIPGDEENYAVGLSVFHQLHCLNLVRQGLYPDYYADPVTGAIGGVPKEDWPDHLSHCLDNVRQALMCSSDISLVVWQWGEVENRASIRMDTVHSCRNFDRIADWAKAHRRRKHFNMTVHVEDDIEIPVF